MKTTGLTDVLLEAGLVGLGTMYSVLSGKNYNHAIVCHKATHESLERLLFKLYLDSRGE